MGAPSNSASGTGTLADWLLHGYGDYLPLGQYYSAPSANFNNSQFQDAMTQILGKEVLFPVYRLLTGPGSNAKYDIIGWVGFIVTSFSPSGSSGTITGHFTSYTADHFGPDEQRELAETARELVARGCQVMLSNSDTPFIRSLYKGFRIDVVKFSRAINSNS